MSQGRRCWNRLHSSISHALPDASCPARIENESGSCHPAAKPDAAGSIRGHRPFSTGTDLLTAARPATKPMDLSNSKTAPVSEHRHAKGMEPKRKAYLIPQAGGDPVAVDSPQIVVGRSSSVDCTVVDPQVSRRHALVLAVHNVYYVHDLDSTNGTFINGEKVGHEHLSHGDLVVFGNSVFRFEVGSEPDTDYLEKLNLDAIMAMAEVVDKKDAYNRGHSVAVSHVAEWLAMEMGHAPSTAERIAIAGRLHDIGKIGVPDAVLRKAGRLNDTEFALVRHHPADGEAILAPLDFLADLLPIVRHHHERFDGLGYPDGLSGKKIPEGARIVQIADAYHAMASERPYRKPLAADIIRHEFNKSSGVQFDPEATKAFLRLLPRLPEMLAATE